MRLKRNYEHLKNQCLKKHQCLLKEQQCKLKKRVNVLKKDKEDKKEKTCVQLNECDDNSSNCHTRLKHTQTTEDVIKSTSG